MLFYNTTTGALKIGFGDGTGHFTYTSSTISPGYQIQRGDFNRDGKTDLLLYRPTDGAAYVALSNGDGTFTFIGQNFSAGFTSVAVADYNGDGVSDVMLYSSQNFPFYSYYLGDGTGHFNSAGIIVINETDGRLGEEFDGSVFYEGGYTVYPADLNSDGKGDFVLYRPTDGTVVVAISSGDSFTYYHTLTDPGITAFKIGDVNGDGFPDLVLYNSVSGAATLFLGDGAGNFPTSFSLTFGTGYTFMDLRDLNGDGKQDVILYNSSSGASLTGISNGTGFAYAASNLSAGGIIAQ